MGGTVSAKFNESVTHLLCNDAEFAKQSAKVKQVLKHNAREDVGRIWIVDQAWLAETVDNGERPDEEDWDLELNMDEEDAQLDQQERDKREQAKQERKRKRDSEAIEAAQSKAGPSAEVDVDEDCSMQGKVHLHSNGKRPYHALLTKDEGNGEKFYIVQLLQSNTQNLFWVFTRTGKQGSSGKSNTQGPFGEAQQAVQLFDKRFKEKTKLTWSRPWEPTPEGAWTVVQPTKTDEDDFDLDAFELDEATLHEIDALDQQQQRLSQASQGAEVKSSSSTMAEVTAEARVEEDTADMAQRQGVDVDVDEPATKKARLEKETAAQKDESSLAEAGHGTVTGSPPPQTDGDLLSSAKPEAASITLTVADSTEELQQEPDEDETANGAAAKVAGIGSPAEATPSGDGAETTGATTADTSS